MRNRIFFGGILITFLVEFTFLIWFAYPKTEPLQDTVSINEIIQTVQSDWDSFEAHSNHTTLDYVVLDSDGAVLYRTNPGLSESINAGVNHKDSIFDIEVGNSVVGKLIVYNKNLFLEAIIITEAEGERI